MNNENYPTKKIIGWFTLLGGGIGGVIIALGLLFLMAGVTIISDEPNSLSNFLGDGLIFIILAIIMGSLVGCIPAFMSACIVAKMRLTLATPKIYKKLFIIGSSSVLFPMIIFTVVYGLYLVYINWEFKELLNNLIHEYISTNSLSGVFGTLAISGISGLTAMILGKFTLPKQ